MPENEDGPLGLGIMSRIQKRKKEIIGPRIHDLINDEW